MLSLFTTTVHFVCCVSQKESSRLSFRYWTPWHLFPFLNHLSSATFTQLSVFYLRECLISRASTALPHPVLVLAVSPSQDKSDLRSSVIQNTDTIWPATHSEHAQSLP